MPIESGPPPRGTYAHVLARFDLAPANTQKLHAYFEVVHSRAVEFRGKTIQALFTSHDVTRNRAVKLGWKDITREWMATLPEEAAPPAGPELSASAEALLLTLRAHGAPMSRGELVDASGIEAAAWAESAKSLVDAGLVERSGVGRNMRYALTK